MPLVIDLYCGLGGWAEGFISEGYSVIGFDIERHDYGTGGYPAQLVLQDVTTLHGAQFRDAAVIVASPPCQAYSYRAMPWSRAKALPPPDNSLFDACFRIQREANDCICDCTCCRCENERLLEGALLRSVTGGHCHRCNSHTNTGVYPRHIPLIVENVRGAQKWVGRAKWHFGSYYLWGDVPALMPITFQAEKDFVKLSGNDWNEYRRNGQVSPHWRMQATKGTGASWFTPNGGSREAGHWKKGGCITRCYNSKDIRRKAASAMIAKIPFPLAQHIARTFKPIFGGNNGNRND